MKALLTRLSDDEPAILALSGGQNMLRIRIETKIELSNFRPNNNVRLGWLLAVSIGRCCYANA